jgi:hypothetical protein
MGKIDWWGIAATLLLEKKYLKTIFNCHQCAGTLDAGSAGRDVEITVIDIDSIVHKA